MHMGYEYLLEMHENEFSNFFKELSELDIYICVPTITRSYYLYINISNISKNISKTELTWKYNVH